MPYPHNGNLVVPANVIVDPTMIRHAEPKLKSTKEKYKNIVCKVAPFDTPNLFEHAPRIDDIRQGGIGDCFLLSSIIAIIDMDGGPQFIEDMMVLDQATQQVTVRLYEVNRLGASRNVRYVTVDFTEIVEVKKTRLFWTEEEAIGNRGAAWVHVLEKAYSGYDMGNVFINGKAGVFWDIADGGWPYESMQILRGGTAKYVKLQGAAVQANARVRDFNNLMTINPDAPSTFWQDTSATVQQQQAFTTWLVEQQIVPQWLEFFYRYYSFMEAEHDHGPLRLSHIEKFLQLRGCDAELVRMIMENLTINRVFPGKRFTGNYLPSEVNGLATITLAMDDDDAVQVVWSDYYNASLMVDSTSGKVLLTEKPDSHGLVWGHAYAVIRNVPAGLVAGIVPDPEVTSSAGAGTGTGSGVAPAPTGVPANVRGLWVCNPWASQGRGYRQKTDGTVIPTQTRERIFWIELSDLTRRFPNVGQVVAP